MIGISHISHCYSYLVAMATKRYLNNSFVVSPIEFIFDMGIFRTISHIPFYYSNSVVMANRVKPGNKQHPGLLFI